MRKNAPCARLRPDCPRLDFAVYTHRTLATGKVSSLPSQIVDELQHLGLILRVMT